MKTALTVTLLLLTTAAHAEPRRYCEDWVMKGDALVCERQGPLTWPGYFVRDFSPPPVDYQYRTEGATTFRDGSGNITSTGRTTIITTVPRR